MVYCDLITSPSDLKEIIEVRVRNVLQFMLLSTDEYAILRFQVVTDNGGHIISSMFCKVLQIIYVFLINLCYAIYG